MLLDNLEIDEDMIDTEFEDLAKLYSGQIINFCDFSQFVLACGEHLHPCYRDNVIEVNVLLNSGRGLKNLGVLCFTPVTTARPTKSWS